MLHLTVVLALTAALTLPAPVFATGEEGVTLIGVDELWRLQQMPRRILIVDVRSPEEFQDARIKGAVNVPVTEIERHFGEIPRQGLVVLY
jgi:rhodanese-related sulfurtransferase